MPGSISPIEPGLSGPSLRMAGAGRAGLGHAPAALQLHVGLALEDLGDLDRQRRAARSATDQRRHIALVEIGKARDRDPHGRHAGKRGGALDLDVAHHGLDIEALVQRDQIAEPDRGQQHHGQRVDVKQRQHADHALDRIALQARRPAPDLIDRYRRRQIAVAEHRAFRQSRRAAGILQQRDVIGRDFRPVRRLRRAFGEFREGDDGRISGIGACGLPTAPQRSSSQTISRSTRPFSRNFSAVGNSAARFDVTRMRAPLSLNLWDSALSPSSGERCAMRAPAFSAPKKLTG